MRFEKYAGAAGSYKIPAQTGGSDTFGELVQDANRLPGVDGGRDRTNGRRAPQAIGTVQASWWLLKDYGPMGAQRDEALRMVGWPKSRLFAKVWDEDRQGKRWVWAKVNNVRGAENVRGKPHTQQTIQATWQVDDPGWRGSQIPIHMDEGHVMNDGWRMEGKIYMDEGHLMDSGLRMNAVKLEVQAQSGGEYAIRNAGTRPAKAIVRVRAMTERPWTLNGLVRLDDGHHLDGGGQEVGGIEIELRVDGEAVCAWTWGGTLASGEELVVDAETQSVYVNGVGGRRDAYTSWRRQAGTMGFLEVPPGEHTIRAGGGIGPLGCTLIVDFWDMYYTS